MASKSKKKKKILRKSNFLKRVLKDLNRDVNEIRRHSVRRGRVKRSSNLTKSDLIRGSLTKQKKRLTKKGRYDIIRYDFDAGRELEKLKICRDRKQRRSVLFAVGKSGRGVKIRGKREYDFRSNVRC